MFYVLLNWYRKVQLGQKQILGTRKILVKNEQILVKKDIFWALKKFWSKKRYFGLSKYFGQKQANFGQKKLHRVSKYLKPTINDKLQQTKISAASVISFCRFIMYLSHLRKIGPTWGYS